MYLQIYLYNKVNIMGGACGLLIINTCTHLAFFISFGLVYVQNKT